MMTNKSGNVAKKVAAFGLMLVLGAASSGAFADPGARAEKKFNRVDQNQDSFVSVGELLSVVQRRTERAFKFLDTNKDGEIQLAEAEAKRDVILARLSGVDPVVTEEIRECMEAELGVALPDLPAPGAFFETADADDSQAIDRAEWSTSIENKVAERFGKIDLDNDQLISRSEFQTMMQQKMALKLAKRQCASTAFGLGF